MGIRKGKFNIKADGCVMMSKYLLNFFLVIVGLSVGCSSDTDAGKPSSNPATNVPPGSVIDSANNQKVANPPGVGRPTLLYEAAPEDSTLPIIPIVPMSKFERPGAACRSA